MHHKPTTLKPANSVSQGLSPQEQLQKRKKNERAQASDIAQFTLLNSLSESAHNFSISETSVIKLCISRAKRDNLDLTTLITSQRQSEITNFIVEAHTISIKRLIEASKGAFSEGEIRLVRYLLQQQDSTSWDF